MIITLSGKPGSGKSTIARKLAAALGYKRYYIGGLRREAAKARGMALDEFNKLGEASDITDREFDELIRRIGKKGEDCIVEGRLAFHFIPHSLKIFLDVSAETGAERIWGSLQKNFSGRNESKSLNSFAEVSQSIRERVRSDARRYQKHYGIVNIFNPKHYDLYLDTSDLNQDEEYRKVFQFVKEEMKSRKLYRYNLNNSSYTHQKIH